MLIICSFYDFRKICKYFKKYENGEYVAKCRRPDCIPSGHSWSECDPKHCPYMNNKQIDENTKGGRVMGDICINDCKNCSKKYQFPFSFCCLVECGEHEFCKGCDKGLYLKGETYE